MLLISLQNALIYTACFTYVYTPFEPPGERNALIR